MKVKEAYQVLYALVADGHGECELVAEDTRNGCSSSVAMYSSVKTVAEDEECGHLINYEVGTEYVAVYLDH